MGKRAIRKFSERWSIDGLYAYFILAMHGHFTR